MTTRTTTAPPTADLQAAYSTFLTPPQACRPTPLFWWTGGDVDRHRLRVQLAELASKGVGGTIVGYSHLPDGDLDHGAPEPLTDTWWELFTWFTQESARHQMTVGLQDYCLHGPILLAIGEQTRALRPGTLTHVREEHTGPGTFTFTSDRGELVTATASNLEGHVEVLTVDDATASVAWTSPAGRWQVSVVVRQDGAIGPYPSSFDPMHPDSGRLLIDTYYSPFAQHLGDLLGTTFTTFFQDELDFGLRMPLWNDLVARRLHDAGFEPRRWLSALWEDLGPRTLPFRAAYRDIVVALLEDHYFEPIFRWHRAHSTAMFVDQVSRGDLRSGRHAYGDYMQTMRWFDGPGNDDPDLTTPRSIAAFKVSASIARLNDRPVVASEAFHSSGWGIAVKHILGGLNAGFAYGVNHVMMHGLDHTSEGGWWEWASPDFHFRQPWWQHSDTLWSCVTRTSALLRYGHGIVDVAVLDPTQDLDLTGDSATSPEYARSVLTTLTKAGIDCDLIDRLHLTQASIDRANPDRANPDPPGTSTVTLTVGSCRYQAIVVPDVRAVREDVRVALEQFSQAGGRVLIMGEAPAVTETGFCPPSTWVAAEKYGADSLPELPGIIADRFEPDFDAHGSGLIAAHRRQGSTDVYFITNVTNDRVTTDVDLRARGNLALFDPWTAEITGLLATPSHRHSSRVSIDLPPGIATFVVVDTSGAGPMAPAPAVSTRRDVRSLTGPWIVEAIPTLDNQFGDFEHGGAPMGVETWHISCGSTAAGPWSPAVVRDGSKFLVLGPVAAAHLGEADALVLGDDPRLGQTVSVAGESLTWRSYAFAYQTGITDDPLLLDRGTGPHGLKHVPDDFLDPTVLDPDAPAGSLYYFWSTVQAHDAPVTVSVGTRAAYQLWIDREPTLDQPGEVAAARTPAWGLRDLSITPQTAQAALSSGRHTVLLRTQVATDQPTRAFVVLSHHHPAAPPRARLRWWFGPDPSLTFDPLPDVTAPVWIRVMTPPGMTGAQLKVHGQVHSARTTTGESLTIGSGPTAHGVTDVSLSGSTTRRHRGELVLEIHPTSGFHGAAVLDEPITWTLTKGQSDTSWFVDHGLHDFSGLVRYHTTFTWETSSSPTWLSLPGLQESARIWLNCIEVGTVLTPSQELEVTTSLASGTNTLDIDVANTLVNRFSVLPSPFSHMQDSGGGFARVNLATATSPDDDIIQNGNRP